MAKYSYKIAHGVPANDYFTIIMPCYRKGGLDCSCYAMGIGHTHTLANPYTFEETPAVLISRRHCDTCSDIFDTFAYISYGIDGKELLSRMERKYDGMIPQIVEVWTFKKE